MKSYDSWVSQSPLGSRLMILLDVDHRFVSPLFLFCRYIFLLTGREFLHKEILGLQQYIAICKYWDMVIDNTLYCI